MKKRILSALLAVSLTASLCVCASAKTADVTLVEKAAVLKELEIMEGDPSGNLNLSSSVTRAEFVKLLVAASPYKDNVSTTAGTDPYPDVSHLSWYAPYVRLAVDLDLVQGDLTGYFHPENTITLAEGVTMAVRLLGYSDSDFTSPWPGGQMGLYKSLKLDEGLAAQDKDDLLTRQDCLHLFYNLLTVKTKSGTPYITQLGYALNADGEVDVSSLLSSTQSGPLVLTGSWQSLLPFDPSLALIYRDGDRASLRDLREWDVLYWNEDPDVLLAYSGQDISALTAAVEGPVEVQSGWESALPFSLTDVASITRNGGRAALSDIQTGDLVYWSEYTRSLAAYSKTVSGTVEAVTPSLAAPSAVVIAGQTYALETLEAQYAFSDLGQFQKGDAVTLLLGRTGGAAAVKPLTQEDSTTRLGVVSALTTRSYTDASDQTYAQKVVVLTGTDGKEYVYPYAKDDLNAGDLVSVTQQGANVTVKLESASTLSGQINSDSTRLGDILLSPDVEILDTYGDSTFRAIPASRLANVTLERGSVRGYTLNSSGAICSLILKDVTGDCHRYGVLTDAETVDFQMVLQGVYTVDLNGPSQVYSVSGKKFSASKGPVAVKSDAGTVEAITNLTAAKNATLSGQSVSVSGKKYTLADDAAFYLYTPSDRAYTLITRSQALAEDYTLTAWYDRPDTLGGRVRIVVAQSK